MPFISSQWTFESHSQKTTKSPSQPQTTPTTKRSSKPFRPSSTMKFSLATTLCLSALSFAHSALGWEADFFAGDTEIGAAGARGRSPCSAISTTRSASSVSFTGGNGRYLLQVFADVGCRTLIKTFANADHSDVRTAVRGYMVVRSYTKREVSELPTEDLEAEDYVIDDETEEDSSLEKRLPGVQCQLDAGNLITSCQDCATSCNNGEVVYANPDCCADQNKCNICMQTCYCT